MASDRRSGDTYFLGDYRIVDDLGMGGMASVHLARLDRDGGFQKWAAVKKIHSHLIEDDSFVTMFLDEARVAASISHPNVAAVFDLGKDGDTYWIAMEYLHGEPLRDIMRKTEEMGQLMPPEIACRIIADAAEGLHAAHELTGKNGEKLGLVHRDVTPHNLFVTYDGVTKVVDFGIAKFSSRSSSTRAGTLKGKLAYMSPEQVAGEGIDRRTDIFALGVVLWEMTTGQRLFRMDSDLDTLAKVQDCNVPRPSTIVRGYPVDLEKIVLKALTKNRAERYRTAREFSRALQSFFLRRGLFISNDEVSHYMHSAFQERIAEREAHMRWAAEVTSGQAAPAARPMGNARPAPQAQAPQMPQMPQPPQAPRAPIPPPSRPAVQERPFEELDDGEGDMPTLIAMNGAAGFVAPGGGSPFGSDLASLAHDDDDDGEDKTIVEAGTGGAPAPAPGQPAPQRPAAGAPAQASQTIGMQAQQRFAPPPAPVGDFGPGASPFGPPANQGFPPPNSPSPFGANFGQPSFSQAPAFSSLPAPGNDSFPPLAPSGPNAATVAVNAAVPPAKKNWGMYGLIAAALAALVVIGVGAVVIFVRRPTDPAFDPKLASAAGPFQSTRADFAAALAPAPVAPVPTAAPTPAPPPDVAPVVPPVVDPPKDPEPVKPDPKVDPKPTEVKTPTAKPPATAPGPQPLPIPVKPPTKPVGNGTLNVFCLSNCTSILVDNSPAGTASVVGRNLTAGNHSVTLVAGSKRKTVSAKIEAGKATTIRQGL